MNETDERRSTSDDDEPRGGPTVTEKLLGRFTRRRAATFDLEAEPDLT